MRTTVPFRGLRLPTPLYPAPHKPYLRWTWPRQRQNELLNAKSAHQATSLLCPQPHFILLRSPFREENWIRFTPGWEFKGLVAFPRVCASWALFLIVRWKVLLYIEFKHHPAIKETKHTLCKQLPKFTVNIGPTLSGSVDNYELIL